MLNNWTKKKQFTCFWGEFFKSVFLFSVEPILHQVETRNNFSDRYPPKCSIFTERVMLPSTNLQGCENQSNRSFINHRLSSIALETDKKLFFQNFSDSLTIIILEQVLRSYQLTKKTAGTRNQNATWRPDGATRPSEVRFHDLSLWRRHTRILPACWRF